MVEVNRISKIKNEKGLLIKISAYFDESKQKILTLWMIAWTLCGLAVATQVFTTIDEKLKIMILVFLAFWLYFEYIVIKAYRWRKGGEEQFLITDNTIQYGRTVNNRGFLRPYQKKLVKPVRFIDNEVNTLYKVFADSYWVIGGERLAFLVNGKVIPFGLRLTDNEAKKIMKIINDGLN